MRVKIATALYFFMILAGLFEIVRGNFMNGLIGLIIAWIFYKLAKLAAWKPRYAKDDPKNETLSETP